MFDLDIYGYGFAAALAMAVLGWLASIPLKDAGIADLLWSPYFAAMAGVYALSAPSPGVRTWLVLFLVTLWAARLTVHIARRNRGAPEDRRYAAMRAAHDPGFWWKSLYLVFGLQGILAWAISLPLLASVLGVGSFGWVDLLALGLWLVGFFFEAVGDRQLVDFKSRPENSGQVMDRGLWRYTRHPNYFGEACMWWGFYLFALAAGGWWTLPAPVLMTWLLLRVSGVRLLEQDIGERRPGYRDYVLRTNAFIPGPPRPAAGSATSGATRA